MAIHSGFTHKKCSFFMLFSSLESPLKVVTSTGLIRWSSGSSPSEVRWDLRWSQAQKVDPLISVFLEGGGRVSRVVVFNSCSYIYYISYIYIKYIYIYYILFNILFNISLIHENSPLMEEQMPVKTSVCDGISHRHVWLLLWSWWQSCL
jgi:hypothetical protein